MAVTYTNRKGRTYYAKASPKKGDLGTISPEKPRTMSWRRFLKGTKSGKA